MQSKATPGESKKKTYEENCASIKADSGKLKDMGRGYEPAGEFSLSKSTVLGPEVNGFEEKTTAGIEALAVSVEEKEVLKETLAGVKKNMEETYAKLVNGDEVKQDAWNKITFAPANAASMSAEAQKYATDKEAELKKIREEKVQAEAESLARSMNHKHDVDYPLHLSVQIVKQAGYGVDTVFKPLQDYDEKALEDQVKGVKPPILTATTNPDDPLRKKVKKLRESKEMYFQSAKYGDTIYQKTQKGGYRPMRLPKQKFRQNDKEYYDELKKYHGGSIDLVRARESKEAQETGLFISIDRENQHDPIPIKNAKEVNEQVMVFLEAAEERGIPIRLDEELRGHLLQLKVDTMAMSAAERLAYGRSDLVETINKVFDKEAELQNKQKRMEVIGRDAPEWQAKAKESEATLVVPATQDAGAATLTAKIAELKTTDPTISAFPDEQKKNEKAIQKVAETTYQGQTPDAKLTNLTKDLDALSKDVEKARDAVDLMTGQLAALTHAAIAQPDDPNVQASGGGHLKTLQGLRAKNETYIQDLELRVRVLKQASTGLDHATSGANATPAFDAKKKELSDRIDGVAKVLDTVSKSNGKDHLEGNFKKYAETQAKQLQTYRPGLGSSSSG